MMRLHWNDKGIVMTIERKWSGVAAAMLLGGVLAACGAGAQAGEPAADGGQAEEPTAETAQTAEMRSINVEVQTLGRVAFNGFTRLTGTVEADQDVTIAAEEAGVVRALLVEKGTRVEAGQPILKIEDEVLRAQYEQAQAQAELARETFERQRRLWEDEQIGSEIAYLETKYGAEVATANAKALAARLERTTVRAPVAGILEDRLVEVGAMVSPGTPVARIIDVDPVKIVAGAPERFAGDVARGAEARVVLDALGGREFDGAVGFVGAAVDTDSRTFPLEVVVPNPDGRIKPGMVATLSILRTALDSAVVVPQQALQRVEDGFVAYVAVERDGATVAEVRPVVAGVSANDRVVIESGLQPGDRLIVVGQQQVAPGDRLTIVARN